MTFKVKVFGAGSIGNHLSHASRSLGYDVVLCDLDPAALDRTKNEIYPARYGSWDDSILLCTPEEAPDEAYDIVVVGTPPHVHMDIAAEALKGDPKAILIEKPLCGPDLFALSSVLETSKKNGTKLFVGYDHAVSESVTSVSKTFKDNDLGKALTLDVEFREHWGGIFAAHPWLSGPWETYLGFSTKGGGAAGEHSHAINLWQHFAQELGHGRVVEVQATLDVVKDDRVDYDNSCFLNLTTETGFKGRCVQDVVTRPSRKWARIQGEKGAVELSLSPTADRMSVEQLDAETRIIEFPKTRPDDFIRELTHIGECLAGTVVDSPILYERGADTMLVIAAAHMSSAHGRNVKIDYSKGYTPAALSLV